MNPIRISISSTQKEFSIEREVLRDYLRGDALMRRFFEPFLFEDPLLLLAERMNSILMKLRSMTSLLACSVVTKHASSSIP